MLSSKPYWDDPLLDSFEVQVKESKEENGKHLVALDKDVIRPEGGGQAGDRGMLRTEHGEARILDTLTEEGRAWLHLERVVPVGSHGELLIDMDWRRSVMRHHTSEHLFVSSLKQILPKVQLGYIWIDGDHGTVEVMGKNIDLDLIMAAETRVQEVIDNGLPVRSSILQPEDIDDTIRAREGVTSKHERIRVVSVEGVDDSACSGIHVLNTKDIGVFKVIDIKISEDRCRIEFLAGEKAVKQLVQVYNEVLVRKQSYPYEMEQIGAVLDKGKRNSEEFTLLLDEVKRLVTEGSVMEPINGVEFRHEYLPGLTPHDFRDLMKRAKFSSPTVLLLFSPGTKASFVLCLYNMERTASEIIAEITQQLGGKGGGSKEAYTGGFTEVDDPQQLYAMLVDQLRKKI